ncbi:SapC family protein [Marinobacterium weihaiense]|uniref:SapC family protein n=1 Tax=Marinobacterium weihaiense TaxID=2851016 RepID=A0ABS6M7N0_9GAMM|nr:SapC family protein [Marinobacterium weihaiense]MBV0932283.1 SapC family protein [Marinobacterium weihaiense]
MSRPDNNTPNTGRAEVLSLARHGQLKFHVANNFAFAADWLYVPVHYKEASRLGARFPVLFYPLPNGQAMPCMLLKSKDKSALSAQMHWQGGPLPDVLRLYPFGFSQQQGRTHLSVYPEAPHFAGRGEKVITSRGKPTQRLRGIIKQLAPVQQAFDRTRPVMQELLALKVLQPITFTLARRNGQRARITLLASPDASVIKTPGLSAAARTLLYVHQQSCRRLFQSAAPAAADRQEAPVDTSARPDIETLIQATCERLGVSVEDVRSRKRSDTIKQARAALAARARDTDQLEALAEQLQRSVETVKKWN